MLAEVELTPEITVAVELGDGVALAGLALASAATASATGTRNVRFAMDPPPKKITAPLACHNFGLGAILRS